MNRPNKMRSLMYSSRVSGERFFVMRYASNSAKRRSAGVCGSRDRGGTLTHSRRRQTGRAFCVGGAVSLPDFRPNVGNGGERRLAIGFFVLPSPHKILVLVGEKQVSLCLYIVPRPGGHRFFLPGFRWADREIWPRATRGVHESWSSIAVGDLDASNQRGNARLDCGVVR